MGDVAPDDGTSGPAVDSARPDIERIVAELRRSVQLHGDQIEATQARTEAVATEVAAARSGQRRVVGDEPYEERIAQLARDVDAIGAELIASAESEARTRRAAAEVDAEFELSTAREEARAMLEQAAASAEQVRTEGGAQLAAIDADRQRLLDERDNVLGALTSLHRRLGDVAGSMPGGQE